MGAKLNPTGEVDRSNFDSSSFVKKIKKPWGYELHFVPEDWPYMFKVLHVKAGERLSLQRHVHGSTSPGKIETWAIHFGRVKLIWENKDGQMMETELEQGKGYSSLIGQRHRIQAITDCEIFEASLPEGDGTTERLDDDYGRPDETAEMRKLPNRGWEPDK